MERLVYSRRGLTLSRFGGYVVNADTQGNILQYSVQTRISRVTSNVNSCSYTHCVGLFPTLHTNRHSPRREFTHESSCGISKSTGTKRFVRPRGLHQIQRKMDIFKLKIPNTACMKNTSNLSSSYRMTIYSNL